MRYYELTINTKEADSLSKKVVSYLPNPPVQEKKNPAFLSLEFYSEPEKISELEKKLKQDALRYLILARRTLRPSGPEVKKLPKKITEIKKKPRVIIEPKPKVELKDIEKKLEEILKE